MKKLLLLLLIAPVLGYGQVLTDILYFDVEQQIPTIRRSGDDFFINGEVKNQYTENSDDYNFFRVPDGKLWVIKNYQEYNSDNNFYNYGFDHNVWYKTQRINTMSAYRLIFFNDDDFTNNNGSNFYSTSHNYNAELNSASFNVSDNIFLKSGTEFTFSKNYFRFIIYEYSIDGNTFSYNEPETIKNNSNAPVLFPNPTSSLLALNSDKEYDIEIYDMAGNKVMALTGNTIDMSHLSSATYIVKALDKVQNEEVSYKVVKN